MGILKNTREFKASGAGKEHTSEVRGGGRDPGVRRPDSGLGRPTARSKFLSSIQDYICESWCDLNPNNNTRKISPEKSLDFLSQKSVLRLA